jgi:hypothetical protein
MASNGTSLSIIAEALNHKSLKSTEIYARLMSEPVLEEVNAADAAIQENYLLPVFKANPALLSR